MGLTSAVASAIGRRAAAVSLAVGLCLPLAYCGVRYAATGSNAGSDEALLLALAALVLGCGTLAGLRFSPLGALHRALSEFDDERERAVVSARDMARQLSWQATHDALTGLVNRSEFERRLEELIRVTAGTERQHVLCYMDLDQFKIPNDTCGHIAGDELLRQVTTLVQGRIRESDTLARLGGDEFGLVLDGCSLEKAREVCQTLLNAVSVFRFSWEDRTFTVSASMGLVRIDKDTVSKGALLSAADAACYTAKEAGRGRLQTYEAADANIARRQQEMDWVARITRAMDENRLLLHAQECSAIVRDDEAALHFELLVRMVDEQGKIVAPGAFLPAAERYDLMPSIDRWVIAAAFKAITKVIPHFRGRPALFAINLSGASINADYLIDFVKQQTVAHGLDPRCVCFEITETVAVNHLRSAAHIVKELKSMGFKFALDDFGSGMSSFAYLKNLPVDYLKIDGGFVREMDKDPVSRSMVAAINQIGHAMGLKTIAEWVENESVLEELRAIGVDFAQGYAIGRPSPLPDAPIDREPRLTAASVS
jgi:diguanylate cyclase (GGDEF)-like protein